MFDTVKGWEFWGEGMIKESALLDLVDQIYEAGCEPEKWPAVLELLRVHLSSQTTILANYDIDSYDLNFYESVNQNTDYSTSLLTHFVHLSPFTEPWKRTAKTGKVYRAEESVPTTHLEKTEYYNDWLRPQEIHHGGGLFL